MQKCEKCGKNPRDKAALEKGKKLLIQYVPFSEKISPAGRELIGNFGRIQLSDVCYWCDYQTIADFFKQ